MVANVSFNPVLTTNARGTFNISSFGYIQGIALDDPSVRNALAGGYLAEAETLPMWGGVGIYENIPLANRVQALGGAVGRATALTGSTALTGFSVFNQDHSMINFPQSEVPLAASNMSVHFYRFGSGARIPLACAPGLVTIDGTLITTQVSWDFVNQQLVPYAPAYAANVISNAVWASTGGGQTTYTVGTDPTAIFNAGDVINVAGIVQTAVVPGTTGFNGVKVVKSVTSTTVVVEELGSVAPATYGSVGAISAGGGALPVRVLQISPGSSMTVEYDPVTGYANWNRQGSVAIVLI